MTDLEPAESPRAGEHPAPITPDRHVAQPQGDDCAQVVVVGGGHNGLVCAAYLARAGLDVCVVEKNESCGGALFSTERGGIVFEHGAIDHSTIVASGIPEDLELERFGLRYLHRTASAVHLFGDGVRIPIAETAEETARAIAEVDEADAAAWLELVELSGRLLDLTGELGNGRSLSMATVLRAGRLGLGRKGRPLIDLATMPVTELAEQWFRSSHMRALAIFRSQFSGLPPWYPGTGAVFCLTTGGHGRRYSRPEGGSQAFVRSLEHCLEASGGRVRLGYPVSAVTRRSDGWLVSSPGNDDLLATVAVVSAMAPQDLLLNLVSPLPIMLRRRMERVETVSGNISQFTLAAALRRTPDLGSLVGTRFEGSQLWLLSHPSEVMASPSAATTGNLAERPGVLVTFPSIIDSTAATGGAAMWANGFVARHLDRPGGWSQIGDEATNRIWSTIESCIPGTRHLVEESVFMSPEDLTVRTGAANPGTHVSATLGQLLGGRPARGSADHRAGIEGIYLTGAGTNPGPSVSGLPGRACAEAVLDDIHASGPGGRARAARRALGREWSRAVRLSVLARRVRAGRTTRD